MSAKEKEVKIEEEVKSETPQETAEEKIEEIEEELEEQTVDLKPEESETEKAEESTAEGDETPKAEASQAEKVEGTSKEEEEKPAAPSAPADPDGTHWYVVHTYSGHENKVAATLKLKIEASHLEDKIFDVMVPTQEKIEIREGKKVKLRERIFPGYVLVKMKLDNQAWYAVRSTAGVTGFVGVGNKPTPLDAKEVETIQSFSKMEAPTYKASFSLGEAVKIVDGPFSDFIGTVDGIDEEKGKIKVLVSIFGRETPVELDFLQVSKL